MLKLLHTYDCYSGGGCWPSFSFQTSSCSSSVSASFSSPAASAPTLEPPLPSAETPGKASIVNASSSFLVQTSFFILLFLQWVSKGNQKKWTKFCCYQNWPNHTKKGQTTKVRRRVSVEALRLSRFWQNPKFCRFLLWPLHTWCELVWWYIHMGLSEKVKKKTVGMIR